MGDIFKDDIPNFIVNSSDISCLNAWLHTLNHCSWGEADESRTIVIAMIKQRINEIKLLKLIS